MNRAVWLAISWLAVLVAVVVAFFAGIEGAAIALGAIAALVIGAGVVLFAMGAGEPRSFHGPNGPQKPKVEAPALDDERIAAPADTYSIPSRKFGTLLLTAIFLHLVAVGVLNLTNLNRALAPDSWAFRYCGVFIAESWADPSYDATWHNELRPNSEICPTYKARSFYQHLNGVVEYAIGVESYTHLLLGFTNMLLGFFAAWIFAKVAERLYGKYAGQLTFLFIIFFPSLIVWTSINLRESWSFLLLSIALYAGMNLREKLSARDVFLFVGALSMMITVRGYLVAVIAMATVFSYVVVRLRQIPVAIATIAFCFLIVSQLASRFGFSASELDIQTQLEIANNMHRGLAYGGSAFGVDADISTPTGALLYLPKGLAMFLLGPFFWSIDSWRQAIAVGETLVWYVLLVRALRQIVHSIRTDIRRVALPLSLVAVMCTAYGLIEGNAGTAYRHRAHAVLIFLMFAAGDFARKRRESEVAESESSPDRALVASSSTIPAR